MRKLKLLLPVVLLLAVCLILPAAATQSGTAMTVYVDQANGLDTNDGLTEATAVQTMDAAYVLLNGSLSDTDTGTIVLVSDYTHTFAAAKDRISASVTSHGYTVVIKGKTADTAFILKNSAQSYLQLSGPTRLEDMTVLIGSGSNKYTSIHAAGVNGSLVIGDNVTTSTNADQRPTLMAAPYTGADSADNAGKQLYLEINSGDWRTVYASGYTNAVVGDATLVMNGGTVNKMAVNYNKVHTGNVNYILKGGTVAEFCPSAGNAKGTVTGDVTVTVTGMYPDKISTYGTLNGNVYFDLAPDGVTLPAGAHSFRDVTGGSLILDPGAALTVTGTVTGTTNISFTDTPATGVTYVTAPDTAADDAFSFTGCQATVSSADGVKAWTSAGEYVFKGLVLTVNNSAYKVILYSGISGTDQIEPSATVTEEDAVKYYFEDLPAGTYHSQVSRNGYYTIKKVHHFSSEQMATETVLDVSTAKRVYADGAIAKWQPIAVQEFTEQMMNNVLLNDSSAKWWAEYSSYLNTPVFTVADRLHQATTQEEMESYIAGLDTDDDNMYVYSIGTSGEYGLDIPIVIFTKTDLSGAATLEEAAALVAANNKVTVHYQAQIHGNEPAGGEAALVTIGRLDTAYGDDLLDTVNIYVIPRLNPDGSMDYTRAVPSGINANRDMLLAQTAEVQAHHRVYNLFMPEIAIDSHEYTVDNTKSSAAYKDMMVGCGYNGNSSEAFGDYSEQLAMLPMEALNENGMEFSFYTDKTNNKYSVTGSMYKGMRGTVSILLESRGIGFGNHTMERRVTAHLICLDVLLSYIAENHQEVQSVSDAERQRITENGKTYEESDAIVLAHTLAEDQDLTYTNIKYDYLNGAANGSITVIPQKYVADATRARPTAYVIPAGQAWTRDVLDLMDLHGISYYYAEAGTAIALQQYTGTVTGAALTEEQTVVFGKGAYVLPMDQGGGTVLALLMEPDLADEYSPDTGNGTAEDVGTLAQMGIIPTNGLTFPIYRYVRDLNEEGRVDTVTAAQSVEYKVYVDSANGSDSSDAYTKATAAQTIEHAFAQLDGLMALAPKGASGTVVFLDLYTLGADDEAYTFPSHDYPVILTSRTGEEGLIKGGTATQYRWFAFGGDTTLDNITVQPATSSTYYYMFANGHKLTVKDTVKTPSGPNTSGNYFNISAGRYSGTFTGNADLTVLGGTWQHLYMGGYVGDLVGDANIVIRNATFTGVVQNAYSGTTTGNIHISLENTTFGSDGAFYAGNASKNDVDGNVTLTLGQNVTLPAIYAGSRDAGDVTGTFTVIADGADLTDIQVTPGARNDTGTVGKTVFVYKTGKVSRIIGFDQVQIATHEDGVYTYHTVTAALTKLSLKPSETGFGYKAEFSADATVQAMLESQGYSLWLTEGRVITRTTDHFRDQLTLRLKNFDVENYGETKVNAKVTMTLSNGITIESQVYAYSMRDMVEAVAASFDSYETVQKQAVQTMCNSYATMAGWNIDPILSWKEEA